MTEKPLIEPEEIMVRVVLTGKSPLLMHHPCTADPDDEASVLIAEIAAKGKTMTKEDRRRKGAIQWRAALYTDEVKDDDGVLRERVIVPMMWLSRAWEEGGKTLGSGTASKGAAVVRSVTPTESLMRLKYDGPQDIAELAADPLFRHKAMVNPNPTGGKKKLLPSVRPIFPVQAKWELTTDFSVVTSMGLSWDDFQRASHAAGNIGIGDARKLGYGRFRVRITKLR